MKNVMEKLRESRFLVNQVAGFLKNRGFSVRHYLIQDENINGSKYIEFLEQLIGNRLDPPPTFGKFVHNRP